MEKGAPEGAIFGGRGAITFSYPFKGRRGGRFTQGRQRREGGGFPWEIAGPLVRLAKVKIYRGFPERLHHKVPYWVEPGALFHVRIALDREKEQKALIDPPLAHRMLHSAKFYEARLRWHITLFVLMPDHLHALLSFAPIQ